MGTCEVTADLSTGTSKYIYKCFFQSIYNCAPIAMFYTDLSIVHNVKKKSSYLSFLDKLWQLEKISTWFSSHSCIFVPKESRLSYFHTNSNSDFQYLYFASKNNVSQIRRMELTREMIIRSRRKLSRCHEQPLVEGTGSHFRQTSDVHMFKLATTPDGADPYK